MRSTLSTPNEIWQQQFKQRITTQLHTFPQDAIVYLGCSGGMDSMLLLQILAEIIPHRLQVISVDHQLQSLSATWATYVAQYCASLSIPCHIVPVHVTDGNLEAAARKARYHAFEHFLKQDDVLILAHHQQDQAETVILRLLQGAGVDGLSAMQQLEIRQSQKQSQSLATQYFLWRPLLDVSKQEIQATIENLQLAYVDDPMNHDEHYDRVWCREQLWSVLQQRFPKMQEGITRSAKLMQDAQDIVKEVLKQDEAYCIDQQGYIYLAKLKQLSPARQRQLLSTWMQGSNMYRPAFAMVERLQNEVIDAKQDASSCLHWAGYYFSRFADKIYRYSAEQWQQFSTIPAISTVVFRAEKLHTIALGKVVIETAEYGLSPELLGQTLMLYPRQGGEKILLQGKDGHRALKKLLQDAKIAPWHRHQIQILMYHTSVLGVFTPQGFWLTQSQFLQQNGWCPKMQFETHIDKRITR